MFVGGGGEASTQPIKRPIKLCLPESMHLLRVLNLGAPRVHRGLNYS